MNRRSFIASLPFLPAAVKAALAPKPECLTFAIDVKTYRLMSVSWHQTPRITRCTSLAYEDAIDRVFEKDPVVLRRNFADRRRVRFRESLARQLAMPAPNLP